MVHSHVINGIPAKTGDLICTADGHGEQVLAGQFWRFIGLLIPGEVDHVAVYIGPGGLCIESGPKGVVEFTVPQGNWDSASMKDERGGLLDTFIGIANPIGSRAPGAKEAGIRESVAQYCKAQARLKKPYNLNFFNPDRDDAFYCSQLAYKAYLDFGINLNSGLEISRIPGSDRIIFPQEIWDNCSHRQ